MFGDSMKNNKKILMYIYLIFLFITPIIVMCTNLFNINFVYVWYIPVMFGFVLIPFFINKKIFSKKNILLFILYLILLISCLMSKDKLLTIIGGYYRFEGYITWLMFLICFYFGTQLKEKEKLRKLLILLVCVATFFSIIMNFRGSFICKLFALDPSIYYFYSGPFDHFNHTAYYLLIVLIVSIYLFMSGSNKKHQIINYIFYFILTYTFIINDTFGAYLSYLFILFILLVYFIKHKENLKKYLLLFITFLILSGITYRDGFFVVYRNITYTLEDAEILINKKSTREELYSIGTDRGLLWSKGFEYIKKRPIIGYGLENVAYNFYYDGIPTDKPHNILIELTLDAGIFFMITFFLIVIVILYYNMKHFNNITLYVKYSMLIVIGYLINSLLGNITYSVTPYFFLFLGICAQPYYEGANEKK